MVFDVNNRFDLRNLCRVPVSTYDSSFRLWQWHPIYQSKQIDFLVGCERVRQEPVSRDRIVQVVNKDLKWGLLWIFSSIKMWWLSRLRAIFWLDVDKIIQRCFSLLSIDSINLFAWNVLSITLLLFTKMRQERCRWNNLQDRISGSQLESALFFRGSGNNVKCFGRPSPFFWVRGCIKLDVLVYE